jgi:hypothetical protein
LINRYQPTENKQLKQISAASAWNFDVLVLLNLAGIVGGCWSSFGQEAHFGSSPSIHLPHTP